MDNAEQLLIDASSPQPPSDEEIRGWGASQSVFVSSVILGMTEPRLAAVRAIETVGARPVWFEDFGGMDEDPEAAYLAYVGSSDIYLGLLGDRYGKPMPSGYSATHAEYNRATAKGLRISVWAADCERDGRQGDFLDEVRVFHTTGSYSSPDELSTRVERRLRTIAAEALTPWVKIGNVVFRAQSVRDDGENITVVGRIQDNTIAASLEARRPGSPLRGAADTRLTWSGGTSRTRISAVQVETGAAKSRVVTITAKDKLRRQS